MGLGLGLGLGLGMCMGMGRGLGNFAMTTATRWNHSDVCKHVYNFIADRLRSLAGEGAV